PTFIDAEAARHVRDGADVKVTLAGALQFGVERRLKDWVSRTQSEAGSAIVMDAGTGEILALANVPDFDANAKGARAAQRRRNRALTDAYEPGSTVKPFLMAAALLSGFRPHDELWGGKGKFTVQGRTISEAEETEQFEWITLEDMVRRSSNVVAAKLALKLGAKSYVGVLRKMGFGSRSGLGFPGEIPGRIPDDQGMQPLTLANLGFGQGFVATRLQVLRAFGALANGGYLVTPKLVMGDGASAQTDRVRVLPDNVVKAVTRAMVRATEQGGTGERARVEGFQIAGKTGTAQTVDPATRSYSRSRYISSFVGFAVGAGTPVVVFVSLDHPKGHYYAADTAAPLFAEVFEETALRMHLRGPETINERLARVPVKPEPLHSTQAAAVTPSPAVQAALKAMEGDPLVAQEENATAPDAGPVDRTMPSLQGLSAREVVRKLGEAGGDLQVEIRGFGMVRHQTPGVGSPLRKGARVSVLLGEDRR
ncbi:MAG TPA: penicillin-binding transpeptidase domain-containing protein, partial [Bdellovibrionota bacterium]|nr:penicillin-binding transpeptidase domain-containing protein [Bdellovibrionota bacterium]